MVTVSEAILESEIVALTRPTIKRCVIFWDFRGSAWNMSSFLKWQKPDKDKYLQLFISVFLPFQKMFEFYQQSFPQQAEGSTGRKGYWASPSQCQNSPHTSFFLLHASSGCPPLSTCVDSHHTPARKHRLTTHETHACVFVAGGCDGSIWSLFCLERCCDWVDDLCLVLCCVPFKVRICERWAVASSFYPDSVLWREKCATGVTL